MTAPGDFTAGDVLQASDMNALNAGLIAQSERTSDIFFGTSGANIVNVSFTLATERTLILNYGMPLITNRSTTNQVNLQLNDDAPTGTITATYQQVFDTSNAQSCLIGVVRVVFSAGTHSLYMNAYTNTGTAQCNNNPGTRYSWLYVFDVGE